jgi:hypothetical protein
MLLARARAQLSNRQIAKLSNTNLLLLDDLTTQLDLHKATPS